MAFTLVSTSTDANNACIASPNTFTAVIEDGSGGIAALANYELFAMLPWWADNGATYPKEATAIAPWAPYHYYKIAGTETAATNYQMQLTGPGLQGNLATATAYWSYAISSGKVVLTITVHFWNVSDFLDYADAPWLNYDKYLKNRFDNPTRLDNTPLSVYNTTKQLRMWVWLGDTASPQVFQKVRATASYTARWWNRDNLNAAQSLVSTVGWSITRNSLPITDNTLSQFVDTQIEFTGTGTYTVEWMGMILVNQNIDVITFIQSYVNAVAVPGAAPNTAATAKTFTDFASNLRPWTIGDAQSIISTGLNSGPQYITIDASKLVAGQVWRAYIVVKDGSNKRYAFISDELFVPTPSNAAGLPPICPADIDSYITNYQQEYNTGCLNVAPMQRLRMRIEVCEGSYCNDIPLLTGLRRVSLSAYYTGPRLPSGTWRHIVLQANATRVIDPLTNAPSWSTAAGLEVTDVGGCLHLTQPLRLRYEPGTPNIITVDNTNQAISAATPLGNQDWSGKTIIFEWTLDADADNGEGVSYTNRLIYIQKLVVKPLDTVVVTMQAQDEYGTPITTICAGQDVCVEASKTDSGDHPILWYFEAEPYSAPALQEEESFAGQLPQLDSPWNSAPLPAAFSSDLATACIKGSMLQAGRRHRLSLTKFSQEPPTDCYCLDFEGGPDGSASEHVMTTPSALLNFGAGPFAVSCWVYTPAGTFDGGAAVSRRPQVGIDTTGWVFGPIGDKLSVFLQNTGGQAATLVGGITPGWNHVVVNFASPDPATWAVYINGMLATPEPTYPQQSGTLTTFDPAELSAPLALGIDTPIATEDYFNGRLANVLVVDQAVSALQAVDLYNDGLCGDPTALGLSNVVWYRLNELSGTTAPEPVNGITGTLTNYTPARTALGGGAWAPV